MVATMMPYLGLTAMMLSILFLSLCAADHLRSRRQAHRTPAPPGEEEEARLLLLFDGEDLIDASAAGRALLHGLPGAGQSDWQRFTTWAAKVFAPHPTGLEKLRDSGLAEPLPAPGLGMRLRAEWRSGLCHITLTPSGAAPPDDPLLAQLRAGDLARAEALLEHLPFPLWSEDADGRVLSANRAYLALDPRARAGPLPQLFPPATGPVIDLSGEDLRLPAPPRGPGCSWRIYHLPGDGPRTRLAQPLPQSDPPRQGAGATLSNFVQALALTFAGLPIGLAVFDAEGRLQLFNPALSDLTGLRPEFLAARPRLLHLLDELRARGRLPEPRNYPAWKEALSAIGRAGSPPYEEIWPLPDGQTFEVRGHSHAPGSITLLIHDISDEVTRSRRLRSELALTHALIAQLDDAVIVFSAGGDLLFANPALDALWGQSLADSLRPPHLAEMIGIWAGMSLPDPIWADLLAYANRTGPRPALSATVRKTDGRALRITLRILPGDALAISFHPDHRAPPGAEIPTAPAPQASAARA